MVNDSPTAQLQLSHYQAKQPVLCSRWSSTMS